MPYSAEQKLKIEQWFEQHMQRCPSCGRQRPPIGARLVPGKDARFEFRDYVVCPYGSRNGEFAAVPIYCRDCGYVVFVSAEVLGLIAARERSRRKRRR